MDTGPTAGPLVVIVGETASGKSAVALELAERFNGEVICADSRTVYHGMDIGTAKPSPEEQAWIPHHLLDVVDPDEPFTVADFKRLATRAIDDISRRGKLPILVGGTGLYIDAVLFDFDFRSIPSPELRAELTVLSVPELQARLQAADIPLPNNPHNPRHLIRALETSGESSSRKSLRKNTLIIGLLTDREDLRERIAARVEAMITNGFVAEVKRLAKQYGWEIPPLQAPGYKAFRGYLEGTTTLEEAKALFVQNDLSLAKRQRTWFKRNNSIHWTKDREITD
jgi:tRNA dimethylallyltransferase